MAHYVYVGVEQVFSAAFSGNVRIGAQFTDIPDQHTSDVLPYLELNGTYQYLPGSYVQIGIRHSRNATDTPGTFNSITIDQESTVANLLPEYVLHVPFVFRANGFENVII